MLSYLIPGGKKNQDKQIENANPELAMREACDEHGEFTTDEQGLLLWDQFLVFRIIIMRQACREFDQFRPDLNARKFTAFKNKD